MMGIEDYQVGLICFTGPVILTPLQRKMAEGCAQMLTMDWGDYQRHQWNKMPISKITAEKLLIWNNRYPNILIELSTVSFPNLTHLIARDNRIVSVECLVRTDLPVLKQLNLGSNLIPSTRSFAKMNLQALQTLNIQSNPMTTYEHLFKANLRSIAKINITDQKTLLQKFGMTNEPVTWKIKLQAVLEEDGNYYNAYTTPLRRNRYHMYNVHHDEKENTSLDYCKIREMLAQRHST